MSRGNAGNMHGDKFVNFIDFNFQYAITRYTSSQLASMTKLAAASNDEGKDKSEGSEGISSPESPDTSSLNAEAPSFRTMVLLQESRFERARKRCKEANANVTKQRENSEFVDQQ
jgi:TFIIF-interacting CTD phosphatase-like protein